MSSADKPRLFVIDAFIPHENGRYVWDKEVITGPETEDEIKRIDFYMSDGIGGLAIYGAGGEKIAASYPEVRVLGNGTAIVGQQNDLKH